MYISISICMGKLEKNIKWFLMVKISIIIVAYNSYDVIIDCISSIEKYNDLKKTELEIIIVDNFQKSILNEKLLSLQNLIRIPIIYIKNSKNGGFGQGNNLGIKKSNGDILFFLNPDTILTENIFNSIIENINRNNNTIIGFTLIDLKHKLNNSYSIFPEMYLFALLFFGIKKYFFYLPNKINALNRMIWPWGAAFAIKKDVINTAGCFDENIFLFNEEPDLLRRIKKRNVLILKSKIIHLEGHGKTNSIDRHIEYLKSTHYYFKINKFNYKLFLRYLSLTTYLKKILKINHLENTNILSAIKIAKSEKYAKI